jgi:hypothetical protein
MFDLHFDTNSSLNVWNAAATPVLLEAAICSFMFNFRDEQTSFASSASSMATAADDSSSSSPPSCLPF